MARACLRQAIVVSAHALRAIMMPEPDYNGTCACATCCIGTHACQALIVCGRACRAIIVRGCSHNGPMV